MAFGVKVNNLTKQINLGNFNTFKVLDNPNAASTKTDDGFGSSVAICDNYAIISAPNEDLLGGNAGVAYVFNLDDGSLRYTFKNNDSGDDYFGSSVGISNNYAIVGAPNDNSPTSDSGKAYIYDLKNGSLKYDLTNPNAYSTSTTDQFGNAVSISNLYAIVGAQLEDDAGGSSSGKAYIYDLSDGSLKYTLDNPNPYGTSADDRFGCSVAITDNYAIVGALFEDEAAGLQTGKAYIYDLSDGSLKLTLNNPQPNANDNFGCSVAMNDTYAVVGAQQDDPSGVSNAGSAYVFTLTTSTVYYTWNNPQAGTSDNFGNSVGISNNYAIVSAIADDETGYVDSGKAFIYRLSDGTLIKTLDNTNTFSRPMNDRFGVSAAISDNYAVVGAYLEDATGASNSGVAALYTRVIEDQTTITPGVFPTTVSFVDSTATSTGTIVIPNSAQTGDLAILCDSAAGGTITAVIPTGFTSYSNLTNASPAIRGIISYKILTASDPGATVTGMAAATNLRKTLLVFRPNSTLNQVYNFASGGAASTATTTTYTLNYASAISAFIVLNHFTADSTVTTRTSSITMTEIENTDRQYVKYQMYSSPDTGTSVTFTMSDAGITKVNQGGVFYLG